MSQKVQFHSLMADSEKEVTDPLTELTGEERLEFLFWLDIHHNTWHTTSPGSFKSVLAGNAPTRYFIPFPRDACPFPGRVVSFDPPKSMKKSFGCTSGTIVLDQGSFNLELEEVEEGEIGVKDMKDVKVTFHRSCFWIYGRKMAKADLSHVLQPNQKVRKTSCLNFGTNILFYILVVIFLVKRLFMNILNKTMQILLMIANIFAVWPSQAMLMDG